MMRRRFYFIYLTLAIIHNTSIRTTAAWCRLTETWPVQCRHVGQRLQVEAAAKEAALVPLGAAGGAHRRRPRGVAGGAGPP